MSGEDRPDDPETPGGELSLYDSLDPAAGSPDRPPTGELSLYDSLDPSATSPGRAPEEGDPPDPSGVREAASPEASTGALVPPAAPPEPTSGSRPAPWLATLWEAFPRPIRERYLPRGVIGEGGMGIVLEAWDREMHRLVAVKGFKDPNQASREARERQATEARIMARFTHPNILPVFDIWKDTRGQSWYSMARIPGDHPTLVGLLSRYGDKKSFEARPLGKLIPIYLQICRAMAYAHGQGVHHRDIKPENILLGPGDEALVADWGVAREVVDGEDPVDVVGTPGYAAPEQLDLSTPSSRDGRSDIYSLGILLFEMVVGRRVRDPVTRVESSAPMAPIIGPPRIPARVPRELTAIIEKATRSDPVDRYADVGLLIEDVETWIEGGLLEDVEYSTVERVRKWLDAHPLQGAGLVFLGVTIIASLVVGGVFLRSESIRRTESDRALARAYAETAKQESLAGRFTRAFHNATLALETMPAGFPLPDAHAYSALARSFIPPPLSWGYSIQDPAECIGLSPGGTWVAAGDMGGAITLWEVATGERVPLTVAGLPDPIQVPWSFLIDEDRRVLVVGDQYGRISILDPTGTRSPRQIPGHSAPVVGLDLDARGRLVSVGFDGFIRVWDLETGERLHDRERTGLELGTCAFDRDSGDIIFNDSAGTLFRAPRGSGPPTAIATCPFPAQFPIARIDGRRGLAAIVQGPDQVWIHDWSHNVTLHAGPIADAEAGGSSASRGGAIKAVEVLDDRTVVFGQDSGDLIRWNPVTRTRLEEFREHTGAVTGLAASVDGRTLVSLGQPGELFVWDLRDRTPPDRPPRRGVIGAEVGLRWSLDIGPDDRWIVGAGEFAGIEVHDRKTGRTRNLEGPLSSHVWCIRIDPTGRRVATAGEDGTIRVAELDEGRARILFDHDTIDAVTGTLSPNGPVEGARNRAMSLAFSPDGSRIVSSDDHGSLVVTEVSSGQTVQHIRGLKGHTKSMITLPERGLLAAAWTDHELRFYRWEEQGLVEDPPGVPIGPGPAGIDRDGQDRRVALAQEDGRILLVDVLERRVMGTYEPGLRDETNRSSGAGNRPTGFRRSTAPLWDVALSADGETLVACSQNRMIWIWSREDPHPRARLQLAAWAPTLALADGGTTLYTGRASGIETWNLAHLDVDSRAFAQAQAASPYRPSPTSFQLVPRSHPRPRGSAAR